MLLVLTQSWRPRLHRLCVELLVRHSWLFHLKLFSTVTASHQGAAL
jgi:hypothetical protein